jgi:hypothetical protein
MSPKFIISPCGNVARWDSESDMGYRCMTCFAMVGSIGQPRQCQEIAEMYKMMEILGGQGWDYENGKVEEV